MARHVIPLDMDSALELVWDDEAGTVEGENWYAAGVREELARGAPLDMSGYGQILILEDPAHDPRDFWRLLPLKCWKEPLRSQMPAILRDVAPTEGRPAPPPRIIDANGVERDAIEGVEFVW